MGGAFSEHAMEGGATHGRATEGGGRGPEEGALPLPVGWPQQASVPEEAMPMGTRFWHPGQGIWVARWGPPTSSKARGKVSTVEPLPPEMN